MRARTGFVVGLSLAALFLSGCGAARQPAALPTVIASRPLVALRDAGILRLVDPTTGVERWRMGNRDTSVGLAIGSDNVIFASVTAADGANTEVHALSLRDFATEKIGTLPGFANANRVSVDGSRLYLLTYTGSEDARAPDRVLDLPIPDRWRGTARNVSSRVAGGAALAPNGDTWYRVIGTTLEIGDHAAGISPAVSRLSLPASDSFTSSLLMSPDGRTLDVIDFRYGESVYVIDVARRTVVQTGTIRPQATTKQTTCAASLSPQGDRLYIAANNGPHENGIDVIDTITMMRIANFLPGRAFYCLGVSPDGKHLYATSGGPIFAVQKDAALTTLDARTGSEERTVPITIEIAPALAFATNIG